MKKLKITGIVFVGLCAFIGIVSAYSVFTFDEVQELESDLAEISRLVQKNKRFEEDFNQKWNEAKTERQYQQGRYRDKLCTLARIKQKRGMDIFDSTKEVCSDVFTPAES